MITTMIARQGAPVNRPLLMARCWRCGRLDGDVWYAADPLGQFAGLYECADRCRCNARREASQYGEVQPATAAVLHQQMAVEAVQR